MNNEILDSNFIEKETLYQDNLTTIERLKAMALDHFILCLVLGPILVMTSEFGAGINQRWVSEITMLTFFGIYLNKDFLKGRSAAKRILGQVVIDSETGRPAGELKCVIRNFTDFLWIIEIVVIQFSPNRRIGDFIVNTKVVRTEKEPIKKLLVDFREANKSKWITSLGVAMIYVWVFFSITKQVLWF